ncbi:hypothetical protein BH20CHL6_BH20CHL6_12610 [soil metagenome]
MVAVLGVYQSSCLFPFTGASASGPCQSAPGNLRVDYVLPRKNLRIADGAVFWPRTDEPTFELVGAFPFPSSDIAWYGSTCTGRRPKEIGT